MKRLLQYLSLFWLPSFRRLLKRIDSEAYQRGWERVFDLGHQRGWMAYRSKVLKPKDRHAYEKPLSRV